MSTTNPPRRFVVLAAIDTVDFANTVAVAARFAAGTQGGELHVVHAVTLPNEAGAEANALIDEARSCLKEAGNLAAPLYSRTVIGHLATGEATREILQIAANLKADLLIVGTHGRSGIERLVIGSVAEHVVRHASCPVLVVREKNYLTALGPQIEPPCPDCVTVQSESNGAEMWCARHSAHHPHPHVFYETPESFALGSSIIRPDTP